MNAMMEEGFNITALEMVNLTEAQATEFFIAYKGVLPEYAVHLLLIIIILPLNSLL